MTFPHQMYVHSPSSILNSHFSQQVPQWLETIDADLCSALRKARKNFLNVKAARERRHSLVSAAATSAPGVAAAAAQCKNCAELQVKCDGLEKLLVSMVSQHTKAMADLQLQLQHEQATNTHLRQQLVELAETTPSLAHSSPSQFSFQ